MNIAIESQSAEIPFNLKIDPKTKDFSFLEDEVTEVLQQVIEAFDMTPADDIDYPEIFSRQREFFNSSDPVDKQRRIADAYRILRNFPEIDPNTLDITINEDERLNLKFRLKTGIGYGD